MNSPLWIATREGQDWIDQPCLDAIAWFRSLLEQRDWDARMDTVQANYENALTKWAHGEQVPLFDKNDAVFWYIHQANAFAQDRRNFFAPEGFRIAPLMHRIGHLLVHLQRVKGVNDRVETLLKKGRKTPDAGLYEILVAGAYKSRDWATVQFVPEQLGGSKTPDLLVSSNRRRWAVECKRINRSGYELEEHACAEALAKPVHELARRLGRRLVIDVQFRRELKQYPPDTLVKHVERYIEDPRARLVLEDDNLAAHIWDADWTNLNMVMAHDDVYFGSSRMVELIKGEYDLSYDHSFSGEWVPSTRMPLHADRVLHASIVSWQSASFDAAMAKAKHFRSTVGRAAQQLTLGLPGAVHVGYEALGGSSEDALRHQLNAMEMRNFEAEGSRLRYVYANYLRPENSTARMESWAVSETTAFYRVGKHRTPEPLPHHLLLGDGDGTPGNHW
ncbi:hypothetical protein H8F23_06275 [Pseudomonas sp. P155]|uniref:Uncharacterized protein n=1 Tax=Pseudomonas neuropathica TaxID=2730425 RepID=A0ABS0BEF1_9PSED|nr:hypothetical protein [Pseudomonas neuropathica]MBF6032850.1 hypothetical protein [Pseudomonas neuropathica]